MRIRFSNSMHNINSNELVGTSTPTTLESFTGTAAGDGGGGLEQHEANILLPPMLPDQLKRLKEDIRKNGLNVPIVLCGGKILDGWQRYQICRQLKMQPRFEEYTGDDPLLHCWSLNVARRHLEKSQLAVLANEMMRRLLWEAKPEEATALAADSENTGDVKNVTEPTPVGMVESNGASTKITKPKRGRARSTVAKIVGVSEGYIQKASELQKTDADLYARVAAGKLNLHQAQRQARGRVYREREAAAKETESLLILPDDRRFTLHHCDILDAPVEDGSLSVILTDPPYGDLDCWRKLGEFAGRKLREGGILLVMSGSRHLPDVFRHLTVEGLNYQWTLCYHMPQGGSRPQDRRVGCHWKPVLWYVKGKYDRTYQPTDYFVEPRVHCDEGKRFHKWGQSLRFFTELVEKFTYADELVCDPFMGGGTTGISCLSLKRRFVGIDSDPEAYATSHKRLTEWRPEPRTPELVMSQEPESLAA